jgi:soluble lytic murein transglycosylase
MSSTSSTSKADMETLEQIIELVRKKKPLDATQLQASISDPVARKLSEWIILRSDDNGAPAERYRDFLAANPTWPSQIYLRKRGESALWDDKRDDATVLNFFASEQPISPKGRFMLAGALLARGDRQQATRRQA